MNGKRVLVTGGNRGLGLELCRLLVAGGADVLLTARQVEAGQQVAEELCQQGPGYAEALQLDVSNPQSVASLLAHVDSQYNQSIDMLVNNAGVPGRTWDLPTFEEVVRVNCTGPVQLAVGMVPHLAAGGSVVMVSSELGQLSSQSASYRLAIEGAHTIEELVASVDFRADDEQAAIRAPVYCLSKAMLNRATQLLAHDFAFLKRHITVNAVCPGWCRTGLGGLRAARSPQQGAESIFWMVQHAAEHKGGFFQDGKPLPW